MPNDEMVEFWNTRGGNQWVREQIRYDAMLEPCGVRLLGAAALAAGEAVLDVGCGNGTTTLAATRLVSPTGRVVGVDLSAPMLDLARQRAATEGSPARFMQADAQTVNFDEPFDAIISRFGVMFFDDPTAAFTNLGRALRAGGRICFVCWKDMFSNDWLCVPAMAAVAHVGMPEPEAPGAPGPFALADPDRIRELLGSAGFSEIAVEEATDSLWMGIDADDVTSFMAADALGRRLLEGKEEAKVAVALDAVRESLQTHVGTDGVRLNGQYWVVTAHKA
jgi:SAM-dependent methyltransferase